MNFKDEYKKDYENVKLDDDFKKSLVNKMNKSPKNNRKIYVYATAALAAAAAVVLAFGIKNNNDINTKPDSQPEENNVGIVVGDNEDETSFVQGSLNVEKWYGDAKNDSEKYEAFCQLIADESLETLYCSDAETFTSEDVLSDGEAEEVLDSVVEAEITDDEFTGEAKNYMAVFESGEIVKFAISNDEYLKLKDMEKSCKLK